MAKIQCVLGRNGGVTYTEFWWLNHFIKTQVFTQSKDNSRNTANWRTQLKKLSPDNWFHKTPLQLQSQPTLQPNETINMASQVLVNTDPGNGTKLLPKPMLTLWFLRFPEERCIILQWPSGFLCSSITYLFRIPSIPAAEMEK